MVQRVWRHSVKSEGYYRRVRCPRTCVSLPHVANGWHRLEERIIHANLSPRPCDAAELPLELAGAHGSCAAVRQSSPESEGHIGENMRTRLELTRRLFDSAFDTLSDNLKGLTLEEALFIPPGGFRSTVGTIKHTGRLEPRLPLICLRRLAHIMVQPSVAAWIARHHHQVRSLFG